MPLPSAADLVKTQLGHAWWTDIYRHWTFDETRPTFLDSDVPGDANAGLAWLYRAQDDFTMP